MFIDVARIRIKGGDGGRGGSVVFKGAPNKNTLADFTHKRFFAAPDGKNGQKRNKTGLSGEDLIIETPYGTVIKEAASGLVMADITKDSPECVLIKGGRGGQGNARFATSVKQAPQYAQEGEKAKEYNLILELKVIADIGLIGFPNAGKSTLLAALTGAKPKIASYPFTTLSPNLGVLRDADGFEHVLADIPGLIEGASSGAGLGFLFLRHVERAKILLHVTDASSEDAPRQVKAINDELFAYNPDLEKRVQIIALNKIDLLSPDEAQKQVQSLQRTLGGKAMVLPVSAITGAGLKPLAAALAEAAANSPETRVFYPEFDFINHNANGEEEEFFTVTKAASGRFEVKGEKIRKMLAMTNIATNDGFAFFQRYIKDFGVEGRLMDLGVKDGDTIVIYGREFEYMR